MRIFVTGGCGYKGSVLITKLLSLNFKITNFDLNGLKLFAKLKILKY